MRKLQKFRRSLSAVFWGFIISPLAALIPLPVSRGGAIFLVHPRVLEDAFLQFPFMRLLPRAVVAWLLEHLWPVIGPPITIHDRIVGRILFCPWTVRMMLEDRDGARKALRQAAQTARHLGAKWLAPGALAASMSSLGRDLRGNGMTITTGHAATTVLGAKILLDALEKIGVEPREATVAVVGAGGNISSTLARRLGGQVGRVILVDFGRGGAVRRMKRLAGQLQELGTAAEIAVVTPDNGYASLRKADAVFTATSNPEPFMQAEWLRPGAIVVDDSQPLSMSAEEARQHNGVVLQVLSRTPGVNCHFRFQPGVGRDVNYTCLAELLVLATNGSGKGVTGPVTPKAAEFIAKELKRAEYEHVFQSFGHPVMETDWERARQARERIPKPAFAGKAELQ